MFGHDDVKTTAKVIALHETSSNFEVNGQTRYEVVLDVAATDGPVFRTTTHHFFDALFSPNPGDVVNVSYDPKGHKTKIHSEGDPRYDLNAHEKQRHREEEAAVEAAKAQPAGTGPDPDAGAQFDPELAQLVEEERREAAGRQPMVETTRQVVDASKIPGLKESILAALRQHGINVPQDGVTVVPPGGATAAPGQAAPAAASLSLASEPIPVPQFGQASQPSAPAASGSDRLQHLQMLRDSGLLSPEEFETLRKQLPGQS